MCYVAPLMSSSVILGGLLGYICLLILLTFHEFAHAWVAWKCGDDTARLQGRVSLNPIVHMDLLGTVALPLLVVFLSAADSRLASFIIGWGKPVPVNPYNLRHRRSQDTLIALAGPMMNLVLAFVVLLIGRGFAEAGMEKMMEVSIQMATISLLLCFFNLMPVPPLDGSHVIKNALNLRDEQYIGLARYGFVLVILLLQVPWVTKLLQTVTLSTLVSMGRVVGLA